MLYGIPQAHLGIWMNIYLSSPFLNDTTVNSLAAANLKQYISAMLNDVDSQDPMVAMTYYYVETYLSYWNYSSALLDPQERMVVSFEGASAAFVETLSENAQMQSFVYFILENLDFQTWNHTFVHENMAISMIASSTAESFGIGEAEKIFTFVENSYYAQQEGTIDQFLKKLVSQNTRDEYPPVLTKDVVSSFISPDNTTMIILLTFSKHTNHVENRNVQPILENVNQIHTMVHKAKKDVTVPIKTYVTGDPALEKDMEESMMEDLKRIDPIAAVLVIAILGIFYRSVVTPFTPLSFIALAFLGTLGILYLVGTYIVEIHYTTVTMLLVVMMAVGVDYCIFVLTRFREERMKGSGKEESVKTAITWAGESITTSGLAVIVAFGVLSMANLGMLKSMGIVIGFGILTTLAMALTLLPSILMLTGDRMFWPSKIRPEKLSTPYTRFFKNAAIFSIKHAKLIVVLIVVISIPATIAVFTLDTSYDFIESMPDTESKLGLDAMAEGFGAGEIMHTDVVIRFAKPVFDSNGTYDMDTLNALETICREISLISNVKKVTSITRPFGEKIPYENLAILTSIEIGQYHSVMAQSVGSDPRYVLISVTLKDNPFSERSLQTVESIEKTLANAQMINASYANVFNGYEYSVAGSTASMRDISQVMNDDFALMRVVVVVGEFFVLLFILGSVVLPIRSIITILISISWTLALTMAVFQFGFGISVVYILPMILFVLLLGLGLDYDIFLITRIREEVLKGKSTNEAIVSAVERTGGIITVCGLIMGGSLGTLMLSSSHLMTQFGFALLFAVFLDAMVVRIFMVPAIMSLLGKWNWWSPRWMKRIKFRR